MPRRCPTFYALLGVPSKPRPSSSTDSSSSPPIQETFDPAHKYVTSPIFRNPFIFAGLRLLTAVYILVSQIMFLEDNVSRGFGDRFFTFFTNLCYTGLCAYFFASGVQTFFYATRWRRNGAGAGYPLRNGGFGMRNYNWRRFLQALHVLLYATVVTFPFIVTAVYWGLLASEGLWETPQRAWNAVSVHILNAVLAGCEIFFSNSPPPPWIALPITVLLLCGYLGLAYVSKETQGVYPYDFLDPQETGKLLAAYIVGIAVGQCVIFAVVYLITWGREKLAIKLKRVIVVDAPLFPSSRSKSSRSKVASKATTKSSTDNTQESEEAVEEPKDSFEIDENEWERINVSRQRVAAPADIENQNQNQEAAGRRSSASREVS